MAFQLSDDEQLIQQTLRTWARDEHGLEAASELDRHDTFPATPLQGLAALGMLGMTLPADKGGADAGATAYALAIYEIAQVCPNTAAILANHAGMVSQAVLKANHTLAAQLAAGELASWLSTEEAYGSDKGQFGTVAIPSDDGWIVTGQKVWAVAASDATHFLVTAQAPEGPSVFWIPRDAQGVHIGQNEALLGLRATGIRTVYLSDVQVAKDHLVGALGEAQALEAHGRAWLQLGVAAAILGASAGAAEAANRFAETRVQFKRPIGAFQAVSDGVVNIDLQLAAGRALLLEAAAHIDGEEGAVWAARAKAYAQNAAIPMTRQAIRIQGGTGFMREGGTERFARDVRALQFMGEPFAVQYDTIKRHLLDIDFEKA